MPWFLACTAPTPVVPAPAEPAEVVSEEVPDPSWTAAEVEALLETWLGWDLPTPAVLERAYFEGLALGDDSCPGDPYQLLESQVPASGCVTAEGTFFEGQSQWFIEEQDGAMVLSLVTDFSVQATDGRELRYGGMGAVAVEDRTVDAEVHGTWLWTEGAGWLGEGVGTAFSLTGERGGELVLDGGVGSLREEGHLTFESLALSEDCEASGRLRVRDPGGDWYALPLGCDGCGELSWADGRDLGEVCVDAAGLREGLEEGLDPETWGP